jgi:hypothetical protein
MAQECRSKAKNEQAHIIQDEEAALMVSKATLFQSPATVSSSDVAAIGSGGEAVATVELREEKVLVQLGRPEESHDAKIWILDTGATNHKTKSRGTFIELDTRVEGTMWFGDDSALEIKGCGKCHNPVLKEANQSLHMCAQCWDQIAEGCLILNTEKMQRYQSLNGR